jgi:hypothetical protein
MPGCLSKISLVLAAVLPTLKPLFVIPAKLALFISNFSITDKAD